MEDKEKVVKIIKDYKSSPNKDLSFAMDFIRDDFDRTKENIIKLTEHLDKIEMVYNQLLTEYQNRNGK
jgi:hypothetical protein